MNCKALHVSGHDDMFLERTISLMCGTRFAKCCEYRSTLHQRRLITTIKTCLVRYLHTDVFPSRCGLQQAVSNVH